MNDISISNIRNPLKQLPPEELPDVYYIIPDMFTRSDVLKHVFKMDGDWFVKELEKRGFYVGKKCTANYVFTLLSIAASLNMGYLDPVTDSDYSDKEKRNKS